MSNQYLAALGEKRDRLVHAAALRAHVLLGRRAQVGKCGLRGNCALIHVHAH